MLNNCLNCKYEPEWGEWRGREEKRCYGECKWIGDLPVLPSVYKINKPSLIERFSDDSGVHNNCKTWEQK